MTPEQRAAVDNAHRSQMSLSVPDGDLFRGLLGDLANELANAETALADAMSAMADLLRLIPEST